MDLNKLTVVPFPHPALRWRAKTIPTVTPLVQNVAHRMIELMHEYKGVGLAATQVAIPWRMFVVSVNGKDQVFINPEVHLGRNLKDKNPRMSLEVEGCLSLPGLNISEPVSRARDVYVKALDISGKPFTIAGPGLLARVIQHENDHLDGMLYLDRLKLEDQVQIGEDEYITTREYVERWLNYLKTQYSFITPPKSGTPTFGTDAEEKQKLLDLESLLQTEEITPKNSSA